MKTIIHNTTTKAPNNGCVINNEQPSSAYYSDSERAHARKLLADPVLLAETLGLTEVLTGDTPLVRGSRVMVAMSGGVDSTVTAAVMMRLGFTVVGATLRLYDANNISNGKTCCAGKDIHDAKRSADFLQIPHYVIDLKDTFRDDVIKVFADTYAQGKTPIPCVLCNQTVKFTDLITLCQDLDCVTMATGHYVRRLGSWNNPVMGCGVDPSRDQSYFLFATTRAQLMRCLFPLGGVHKPLVRAMAHELGLTISNKPDSQDICFVPSGDYRPIVAKYRPDAFVPGDIININGDVIGRHRGIGSVTIGQRHNVGTINPATTPRTDPLHVVDVDPTRNRITLATKDALARDTITVTQINVIAPSDTSQQKQTFPATVRLRSTMRACSATVTYDPHGNCAIVSLDQPEFGIALGQACVIYNADQVWGGGWISATSQSAKTTLSPSLTPHTTTHQTE